LTDAFRIVLSGARSGLLSGLWPHRQSSCAAFALPRLKS
jgi:hypothetical protein